MLCAEEPTQKRFKIEVAAGVFIEGFSLDELPGTKQAEEAALDGCLTQWAREMAEAGRRQHRSGWVSTDLSVPDWLDVLPKLKHRAVDRELDIRFDGSKVYFETLCAEKMAGFLGSRSWMSQPAPGHQHQRIYVPTRNVTDNRRRARLCLTRIAGSGRATARAAFYLVMGFPSEEAKAAAEAAEVAATKAAKEAEYTIQDVVAARVVDAAAQHQLAWLGYEKRTWEPALAGRALLELWGGGSAVKGRWIEVAFPSSASFTGQITKFDSRSKKHWIQFEDDLDSDNTWYDLCGLPKWKFVSKPSWAKPEVAIGNSNKRMRV